MTKERVVRALSTLVCLVLLVGPAIEAKIRAQEPASLPTRGVVLNPAAAKLDAAWTSPDSASRYCATSWIALGGVLVVADVSPIESAHVVAVECGPTQPIVYLHRNGKSTVDPLEAADAAHERRPWLAVQDAPKAFRIYFAVARE